MKKYKKFPKTLGQVWQECLRMWKWIATQRKNGNKRSVYNLKRQWLKEHGYKDKLEDCENCFFCVFSGCDCKTCPGRLVNRKFHCSNLTYHWYEKPIKFYNKLVELNKKRLGK